MRRGVSVGVSRRGPYSRPVGDSVEIDMVEPKWSRRSTVVASPYYYDVQYHRSNTDGTPDIDQSYTLANTTSFLGTDSFVGVTNPFWKDQIRNGSNATTFAQGTRFTYENQWLSWRGTVVNSRPPPTGYSVVESISGYPPLETPPPGSVPSDVVTEVNNRAISKFLEKAEAARSSIEAGQDFGELRESLDAIVNPLGSLRRHVLSYFPKVKKLKGLRGPGLRKALADTYLEWTFGWKPLAQDIHDAHAASVLNDHPLVVPVSASASKEFASSTRLWNISMNPSTGVVKGSIRNTSRYSIRYKGAIRTGADAQGRIGRDQSLQLDLPHFIPTLWDLLPTSFITDYFSTVGDRIRAACFQTSNLTWVARTERIISLDEYTSSGAGNDFGVDWITGSGGLSACSPWVSSTQFVRSPVNPYSLVPSLQFRLPITSIKPWENLGAILASNVKDLRSIFHGR